MMTTTTIQITFRALAAIAEKSPGYSVLEADGTELYNIRFARTASGRRNRAVVLADYQDDDCVVRTGYFDSDCSISILD